MNSHWCQFEALFKNWRIRRNRCDLHLFGQSFLVGNANVCPLPPDQTFSNIGFSTAGSPPNWQRCSCLASISVNFCSNIFIFSLSELTVVSRESCHLYYFEKQLMSESFVKVGTSSMNCHYLFLTCLHFTIVASYPCRVGLGLPALPYFYICCSLPFHFRS